MSLALPTSELKWEQKQHSCDDNFLIAVTKYLAQRRKALPCSKVSQSSMVGRAGKADILRVYSRGYLLHDRQEVERVCGRDQELSESTPAQQPSSSRWG